ncbi:MAG: chromate transporter [Burkholderiales bacterium]|nr:chromate transporter [Burkholderiales bacterium]MDE2453904.1 chromate transporter [Burkholderiales bacterium]
MSETDSGAADVPQTPCSLWQMLRYMLALGTWGFGGPVALVGYMYRDLVDRRRWISESDYKEGMTLAQLMPGPLAAQLAIYLGYVQARVLGATLAGLAFVLPSFLMVVALGAVYRAYGGIAWMQAVFYGVGAAVTGIIALSAWKLTTKNIGRDRLLWALFAISAAVTVTTRSESVWIFLGAGVLVWLLRAPPKAWSRGRLNGIAAPIAAFFAIDALGWHKLAQLGTYFAYAGSFVFGSGLAIVPFLYGGVVHDHHWLNERQFVDAVAVAMITPGPVVITTGFIGYLVAGFWGAVVAAAATFVPCWLFTILPAPYFKRHGKRPGIVAFVDGVTAAAIGAIAGAVIVIGQRAITDFATAALALTTVAVLWRFKKVPEPLIVLVAALVGIGLHLHGGVGGSVAAAAPHAVALAGAKP